MMWQPQTTIPCYDVLRITGYDKSWFCAAPEFNRKCHSRDKPHADTVSTGNTTRDRHTIGIRPPYVGSRCVRSFVFLFLLFENHQRQENLERSVSHRVRTKTDCTVTFFPSLLVSHHSVPFASHSDWLRATVCSTNRVTTMRQRRAN